MTHSLYLLNSLLLQSSHENTLACDVILAVIQRISTVVPHSFPLFTHHYVAYAQTSYTLQDSMHHSLSQFN